MPGSNVAKQRKKQRKAKRRAQRATKWDSMVLTKVVPGIIGVDEVHQPTEQPRWCTSLAKNVIKRVVIDGTVVYDS